MRDAAIIAAQSVARKRDGLILAQFEFLETRQRAYESVLYESRLWDRVRWFFWPDEQKKVVDAVQQVLIEDSKAALAQAHARGQIQRVNGN